MFRYAAPFLTGTLLLLLATSSLAQALQPGELTDAELKQAGWSEQDIADYRAIVAVPEKQESPDTASSPVPIGYSSIFKQYLPFDHVPDIGWREANDRVGEIGGWRAYLELVQNAVTPEAPVPSGESE